MTGHELEKNTIFLTLAGSHAHGTARSESDLDVRGVAIAPLSVRLSYRRSFEQYEGLLSDSLAERLRPALEARGLSPGNGMAELAVFDVAKFVRLCAAANPNALEILFADERDRLWQSPAWEMIYEHRELFLSRKVCETYLGYALAQLKRIQSHRSWLLNPPKQKPKRADFGLPDESTLSADERNRIEAAIAARLRSWAMDDLEMPQGTRMALWERLEQFWWEVFGKPENPETRDQARHERAGRSLGLTRDVVEILEQERRYRAAQKHWQACEQWKKERNPTRARLEALYGYDTKHAMHLVRLMRTGLELVETGVLCVRRPDAAELKAIRDGALTYEQLLEESKRLESMTRAALANSPLPLRPDEEAIDDMLGRVILQFSQ